MAMRTAECGWQIDCGFRRSAIRNPQSALESLQDGADDRAREFGRQALERRRVLLKERGRVRGGAAAGRLVLLSERDARVLPEHLVLAHVAQLDARGHGDGVARGELLR